jgi:hypothetical protein
LKVGPARAIAPVVRIVALLFCAVPALAQTRAAVLSGGILERALRIDWGRAAPASCSQRVAAQLDIYATTQWTHHCGEMTGGIIRESFYYVFGEPPSTALLRVDLRPEDESPELTAELLRALREKLTARFGNPDHAPELIEIGFRRLRYGQPVAGDHWHDGVRHFFLHANQTSPSPMGMRRGVQLVIMQDRLMQERARDEFIHQVDGLGGASIPGSAAPADRDAVEVLRAAEGSPRERKADLLLEADRLVAKLSGSLNEQKAGGFRSRLARYGVKIGPETHDGGMRYDHDLLWRVWREFADTNAGEQAFVALLTAGWTTEGGEGCPANPDLFREVIDRGESYLSQRPQTAVRKEIVFLLAAANESWWSIAHARADDPWVSAPPYPRREINARQATGARAKAIQYYREVVRLAPASPEAASALRRLPRLELGLDTGLRRFYCSYC